MIDFKGHVAAAIAKAQSNLDEALTELGKLPAFDPGSMAFAAHALGNYLTVTNGTIELILLKLADYPDPQVRIWLEGAQHATNLMTRIVSEMINASAPAEPALRYESFDLSLLIQRACSYYQRVADWKSIRLSFDEESDGPPIWSDRVVVAAVLDNLLSNAIKFSPAGKEIRVRSRHDQAGVTCSVQDEGPGLSPEDQARLFQRGARLTPKPTGNESSTGYGLAVAKDLVVRLGGTIWCESTLGNGATFSFRLPGHQGQAAESGVPAP